jgi:tight adherence protein C
MTDPNTLLLVQIAAFFIIGLITFIIARAIVRLNRDPIRERLEQFVRASDYDSDLRAPSPLVDSLADQLPQVKIDNGILDREMRQGGFYSPNSKREYLAIRNGLVIASILITGIIAVAIGPERQDLVIRVLIGGVLVTLLMWAVPRLILRAVIARRVQRIRHSLPYALDMITMCAAGGISLRDALIHVGREIYTAHPDLAVELVIVRQQAELNSLEFALQQFANRIDTPEITAVSALFSHTHRLGVNAAAALQEYADIMRQKWRQEADERANSTSVKLLFPLTMCLLPAAAILLLGPAAIDLGRFLRTGAQELSRSTVVVPRALPPQ